MDNEVAHVFHCWLQQTWFLNHWNICKDILRDINHWNSARKASMVISDTTFKSNALVYMIQTQSRLSDFVVSEVYQFWSETVLRNQFWWEGKGEQIKHKRLEYLPWMVVVCWFWIGYIWHIYTSDYIACCVLTKTQARQGLTGGVLLQEHKLC